MDKNPTKVQVHHLGNAIWRMQKKSRATSLNVVDCKELVQQSLSHLGRRYVESKFNEGFKEFSVKGKISRRGFGNLLFKFVYTKPEIVTIVHKSGTTLVSEEKKKGFVKRNGKGLAEQDEMMEMDQ